MLTSKLNTKAQTTIPQPVRQALGLREGDEIVYELFDTCAVVRRRSGRPGVDDPFRAFEEWSSEADRRAHGNL